MKQNKQPPESLPQVPNAPQTDVPETDRERAENEGMTTKPNQAPTSQEAAKLDMAKAPQPAVYTPQTGDPKIEPLDGEGSYTAARRYGEGVERSGDR